jgi:hypothetical protein
LTTGSLGSSLYLEFKRSANDDITKGRWFSINSVFSTPVNFTFNIHSFGDDIASLSVQDRNTWNLAGGMDGYINYECEGYVTHPDQFVAKNASLSVNPLGSLDRFDLREKGSIGNGCYDGLNFLIRLFLDLGLSQQLLTLLQQPEYQIKSEPDLLGQVQRDATGFDPSGLNVRFDLFNFKYQETNDWTLYDICQIYI